jgi:hypothetical protein
MIIDPHFVVGGGIQPGRYIEFVNNAAAQADGLAYRFLGLHIPFTITTYGEKLRHDKFIDQNNSQLPHSLQHVLHLVKLSVFISECEWLCILWHCISVRNCYPVVQCGLIRCPQFYDSCLCYADQCHVDKLPVLPMNPKVHEEWQELHTRMKQPVDFVSLSDLSLSPGPPAPTTKSSEFSLVNGITALADGGAQLVEPPLEPLEAASFSPLVSRLAQVNYRDVERWKVKYCIGSAKACSCQNGYVSKWLWLQSLLTTAGLLKVSSHLLAYVKRDSACEQAGSLFTDSACIH